MIFVMLLSVTFTAFAPEVIYIMAPSQYHEAVYVIPPISASSFFTFLFNIFSIVGLYYEKTKKIMWASVSGAALNLLLNIICIPLFGYIAAAYTTLVCYMFFSFSHYVIMKSICKTRLNNASIYDMKFILLMSAVMLLFTLIFTITYSNMFVRYGIILALAILVFAKRRTFISAMSELKNSKK
jgi:O-antigen/teichoic acid export membrane protein